MSDAAVIDPEIARASIEYCYEQGWTDGLPVVPPDETHVREFVDYVGRDPDEVLSTAAHLGGVTCTVLQAAINSLMAGCKPEYFPVVLAALESLWGPGKGYSPLFQSTTGPCPMVVVNGPIREQIGLNCKGNVFGPGFRPNATIGRALRLIVMNVFGVRPHELDQSTQSTPAKYTFCFGENEEESPWEPLSVDMGFPAGTSTVTTYVCRSHIHVENRSSNKPEEILLTIADAMSFIGGPGISYRRSKSCVVMGPEHAQLLARNGWSKAQVKQFLWEHYGRTMGDLRRTGRATDSEEARKGDLSSISDDTFIRFCPSPDAILFVVAGANNAGVSAVVPALGTGDSVKGSTVEIRAASK